MKHGHADKQLFKHKHFPFKGYSRINGIAQKKLTFFSAFIRFHTQVNSSGYQALSEKRGGGVKSCKLGGGFY